MSTSDKDSSAQLGRDIVNLFKDMEIDEGRCPKCGSEEIGYSSQSHEDAQGEQVEYFAYCRDCNWSEI